MTIITDKEEKAIRVLYENDFSIEDISGLLKLKKYDVANILKKVV